MSDLVSRLTPSRLRRGFTLPEMLIVIVMISLLALVAIPRFATANGKRQMESARMRVAAALATARAAAIQKGYPVRFQLTSNTVTVRRDTTGATNIISPVPLNTLYKVTASPPVGFTDPFDVVFSGRGFSNVGSTAVIRLSRSGVPDDSVVISKTGMVLR
jgi:prepilin-type N-terminal cleavage/methylation domain-containing protein